MKVRISNKDDIFDSDSIRVWSPDSVYRVIYKHKTKGQSIQEFRKSSYRTCA